MILELIDMSGSMLDMFDFSDVHGYLKEFNNVSVAYRLLLAMLLGGVLGLERGRKKRPAGFRTYMAVCVGSALVMITTQYVVHEMGAGDPLRMGAQVISGIGFLGAGTIIVTGRNQVKGLTTAAGLWVAACIGLAVGVGFYSGAIFCCALIYLSMTLMHRIEHTLISKSKVMDCFVEFSSMEAVGFFIGHLREENISLSDLQINRRSEVDKDLVGVILSIKLNATQPHADLIQDFAALPGVKYIEEIM